MDLTRGNRGREDNKRRHLPSGGIGLNSDTLLVIRLPGVRALRALSHSVFLAMLILTLPFVGNILRGLPSGTYVDASLDDFGAGSMDIGFLDSLMQDLVKEDVVKRGDKALVVSPRIGLVIDSLRFLDDNKVNLVSRSDLEQELLFPNATFDVALTLDSEDVLFMERFVKVGGIVVTELSYKVSTYLKQLDYRIVYIRQYDSTVVAMRKTRLMINLVKPPRPRQPEMEAKKVALEGLEDVFLEPPSKELVSSGEYRKTYKYLPDLLGDALEDYPRRLFILFGLQEEKNSVMAWFDDSYPTRNQEFEFYFVEVPSFGVSKKALFANVLDWLTKNTKEDDFVVMKAGAEVVEEMVKRRIVGLVDEVFLECHNHLQDGGRHKTKRAYWECLTLYGELRRDGLVVHQWWS